MNKEQIKYLYDQYKITLSFVERNYKEAYQKGDMETYNYYWGQYVAIDSLLVDLRLKGVSYI